MKGVGGIQWLRNGGGENENENENEKEYFQRAGQMGRSNAAFVSS